MLQGDLIRRPCLSACAMRACSTARMIETRIGRLPRSRARDRAVPIKSSALHIKGSTAGGGDRREEHRKSQARYA